MLSHYIHSFLCFLSCQASENNHVIIKNAYCGLMEALRLYNASKTISGHRLYDPNRFIVHKGFYASFISKYRIKVVYMWHEKTHFCGFSIEKYRLGRNTPHLRLLTGHHDPVNGGTSDLFLNDRNGWIYKIIEAFDIKFLCRFCITMGKLRGGHSGPPPPCKIRVNT